LVTLLGREGLDLKAKGIGTAVLLGIKTTLTGVAET
jgi:hypothetical protein